MSYRGSCLCGRHRFTAEGQPLWSAFCHCNSCRRSVGAPVATYVGFSTDQVEFTPANVPEFSSSAGVLRGYCSHCGTALFYRSERWPDETHLFRSTLVDPDAIKPTAHVYFDEREPDFDVFDDLPRYIADQDAPAAWGSRPAFRILYLCTGNSARSVLAEGITNLADASVGTRPVRAHSAGSHPTGAVAAEARRLLATQAYRLDRLRSKSWNEFTGPAAPSLDMVITVCDAAAATCPAFAGAAEQRHWGLTDPVAGPATFEATFSELECRIGALLEELAAR